jgi:hypothetical protein
LPKISRSEKKHDKIDEFEQPGVEFDLKDDFLKTMFSDTPIASISKLQK